MSSWLELAHGLACAHCGPYITYNSVPSDGPGQALPRPTCGPDKVYVCVQEFVPVLYCRYLVKNGKVILGGEASLLRMAVYRQHHICCVLFFFPSSAIPVIQEEGPAIYEGRKFESRKTCCMSSFFCHSVVKVMYHAVHFFSFTQRWCRALPGWPAVHSDMLTLGCFGELAML